jgi:Predicted enzyme of the cupin superfamily
VTALDPGVLVAAAAIDIPLEPLPADEVLEGTPSAGFVVLDDSGDVELGVWEMTPGSATDTEADEVFVVLSGSATVRLEGMPDLELAPGGVVRLREGMRSMWIVRETLRKVYWA